MNHIARLTAGWFLASLVAASPSAALEVLSVAHSPTNPRNRFVLQCGRTGVMKVSALIEAGNELPTVLLGAIETSGRYVAMQRNVYEDGPEYLAGAKKVGGKGNRWLLDDVFTWQISCRADCGEVQVGEARFRSSALGFRFVSGGEDARKSDEGPRFAPKTTAESEDISLRCEAATPLPPS